jgi:epoxyqueuosine reductase
MKTLRWDEGIWEFKHNGGLISVLRPESAIDWHFSTYQSWVDAGLNGGMAYLAQERHIAPRRDPALLLPGVRSILSLAFPYPNPASLVEPQDDHLYGRIASYAWTEDYHLTLPLRLDAWMKDLAASLGREIHWRSLTDSAPVLERGLAARGGLGWIGRNGCLIHPQRGSYSLLAEIYTDLEYEALQELLPDEAPVLSDHCGSCRRCIDACPTGCIRSDRTLDAGRCISYLTIEHKGSIPRNLRGKMGNWVFGCDVCQAVCPWNIRFAKKNPPSELAIPGPFPDLAAELELTTWHFKQKYQRTPVLRAKRGGYLRNVCIALGNSGDREAVPVLEQVLSEEVEPLVRSSAAWALSRLGGSSTRETLCKALKAEMDPEVREEIESDILFYM